MIASPTSSIAAPATVPIRRRKSFRLSFISDLYCPPQANVFSRPLVYLNSHSIDCELRLSDILSGFKGCDVIHHLPCSSVSFEQLPNVFTDSYFHSAIYVIVSRFSTRCGKKSPSFFLLINKCHISEVITYKALPKSNPKSRRIDLKDSQIAFGTFGTFVAFLNLGATATTSAVDTVRYCFILRSNFTTRNPP